MNYVEPIKKKNDIKKMYHVLQMKSDRDYLLFKLAIHTGMRLTDLLHLKVEDIKNKEDKEIKTAWIQQGAPFIKIMIPSDLRNEIDTYIIIFYFSLFVHIKNFHVSKLIELFTTQLKN